MAKLKVLLIDDELDFVEIIGVRIESWGYNLIKASNGKEGLSALKGEKPDIVVLDYMMPEMDGVSVLKKIREIDDKIPVIMFTAHPDIKSIEGAQKLGVSSYIPKFSVYTGTQSALKVALNMIGKKLKKEVM